MSPAWPPTCARGFAQQAALHLGTHGRGDTEHLQAGISVKILHIYKDYPPILGGIENHVRLLAEGQAHHGHQVTVLVTNPAGAKTVIAEEGGVRVIRAGRIATIASTPLSLALPAQLARSRPDVVHLHFPYPVGEVSQWLLHRGQATVLTYHSDVVRQAGILRLYRPLLRRVLRDVHAIIIGSPPMRKSAYLAEHQDKLHLVPYGIPLARFRQAVPPAGVREAVSLPTLLFVGRLRYYKGLDYLIRALPQIQRAAARRGHQADGGGWRKLAANTGVAERITWLGEIPDAHLPACTTLRACSCCPPAIRARPSAWCRWRRWRRGCPSSAPSWARAHLTSTRTA